MASCLGEKNTVTKEQTTKWNHMMQLHTEEDLCSPRNIVTLESSKSVFTVNFLTELNLEVHNNFGKIEFKISQLSWSVCILYRKVWFNDTIRCLSQAGLTLRFASVCVGVQGTNTCTLCVCLFVFCCCPTNATWFHFQYYPHLSLHPLCCSLPELISFCTLANRCFTSLILNVSCKNHTVVICANMQNSVCLFLSLNYWHLHKKVPQNSKISCNMNCHTNPVKKMAAQQHIDDKEIIQYAKKCLW